MSRSVEDDWLLDEAEALLDMDGRRERLELAVTDLQSGRIQPVGHAAAGDRIEKRIRDRRTRVTRAASLAAHVGTESAGRARAIRGWLPVCGHS